MTLPVGLNMNANMRVWHVGGKSMEKISKMTAAKNNRNTILNNALLMIKFITVAV